MPPASRVATSASSHTDSRTLERYTRMQLVPIRAFADNYIWLGHADTQDLAFAVDPGDADPLLQALRRLGLRLEAVLLTHHHRDHSGGLGKLKQAFPDCRVYASRHSRIALVTDRLSDGATVQLQSAGSLRVLAVPGHTLDHIAFYQPGRLFCGDTLFSAGCGRVFEGSFEQMWQSLDKIRQLPDDTLVYCAHEYTLDNLGFAKWVEPDNPELLQRDAECLRLAEQGQPSLPVSLAREKAYNPFLRADQPGVRAAVSRHLGRPLDAASEVFAELRQWKDREYD
jgi:hydroxyacylglutathione hydrolase